MIRNWMCWHHRGSNNVGKWGIIFTPNKVLENNSGYLEIMDPTLPAFAPPVTMHKFPTLNWVWSIKLMFKVIFLWHTIHLPHLKLDDVLHLVAGQVQLDAVIDLQAHDDNFQCRNAVEQLPDTMFENQCVNSLKNLHFDQKLDPSFVIMLTMFEPYQLYIRTNSWPITRFKMRAARPWEGSRAAGGYSPEKGLSPLV